MRSTAIVISSTWTVFRVVDPEDGPAVRRRSVRQPVARLVGDDVAALDPADLSSGVAVTMILMKFSERLSMGRSPKPIISRNRSASGTSPRASAG
jgi:hypothetical protein